MLYRFFNARLLTMQESEEVTEGELFVRDDRIYFVGSCKQAADLIKKEALSFDREIDAKGNLLMPGFKDAHTHSGMTFLRSLADDMPLNDWLNKQILPREAKLTSEDIYECTRLAILEYLSGGVTSIFEMYLTPDTIAQACSSMGMRCVQTGGVNNFSQSLEKLEEWYKKYNEPGSLNSFILGFHAEYTCSRELLEGIAELAHKYKAPVFTHNSETEAEVRGCREHTGGLSPTQYLDSLGIYDFGGGGYHCVHFDEKDMEIFQKRGLSVVTNPASNAKLASGVAALAEFEKRGINVAIGTDGPASNNCLDMFREMFLATALAKLREKDASALDGARVLKMATVNGARAMGLTDCDILAAGKKADIIMIDLHRPNMQPLNNLAKNIVYSGSKENVCLTMINGRILYEKGEYANGIDPEEIYARVEDIRKRIV